ncbi:MAG: hypothetical protein H6706_02715 [Myxococcales bacterium]|nr:hypothetical protein [Myxococcales bacterium]
MKSRTLDLALALALLAGCDGGVHRAEPIECDPVADEGCPDGAHCRLLRGGALACLPPEVRVAAGPCGPGSCDPGAACIEVEGHLSCRPVCTLAEDACPDGGACSHGVAGAWGVCTHPCAPGECGDGATCAPVGATAYPICVAVGPASLGEPCAEQRCGAGLACLALGDAPRCERLCTPGEPGPCDGQCTGLIADHASLRFCVTP